jgi:glycosyltransferase involved in cell wall biosynthesis
MKNILASEGVPREHMVVVTNGIDPSKFHPGVSGAQVRRKYGLDGKLVVGFVGWFREWHGLDLLLEVTRRARLAEFDARVLLVGDGPIGPDLRRFVRENGLEGSVVFTGPVPHDGVPAHIAAMDVAVVPSAPEYACPMKIIEYMAMAKCVVAPDQPNIREIVRNEENGVLFAAGDPDALASTLLEVVRDRPTRDSLGKSAFETVCSKSYLWRTNAERAIALADSAKPSAIRSRAPVVPHDGHRRSRDAAMATPIVPELNHDAGGKSSRPEVDGGGH